MIMKQILELIENVDPSDTETLDEIDVLTFCFLNNETLKEWRPEDFEFDVNEHNFTHIYGNFEFKDECQQYTRSLDASKAIQPDGWMLRTYQEKFTKYYCHLIKYFDSGKILFDADGMPTEELARLHAIIQAIQWERDNEQR